MIPSSLRERSQWVNWRAVERDGKTTKLPINPATGKAASSTDPLTWADYDEAVAHRDNWSGIGFVFYEADPFSGIDLDRCRNPKTGAIEPWAREILDELASYSEVSPSGTGVHVIVQGQLKAGGRRRQGNIEAYSSGRYFCMTGQSLPEYPQEVMERQTELERFEQHAFGKAPAALATNEPSYELADDELIDKASHASNGAKFRALWSGQWEGSYKSQSEADLALANLISFYSGRDFATIDRLFRRSGLFREKFDETHGATTYGRSTIEKAIAGTRDIYEPRRRPEPPLAAYSPPPQALMVAEPEPEIEGKERLPSIVKRILHEYQFVADDLGHIYQYSGSFWTPITLDTLRRYAMNRDSLAHTSMKRRNEIANQVLLLSAKDRIDWRSINHYEIPVKNGVVDLRSGAIRPHRPVDYLETVIPHDFVPAAQCPRWLRALGEWFSNDEDEPLKVELLQEFCGYLLMAHAKYKRALILYGPSNTGKSEALKCMISMVGQHNSTSIGVHEMDDPRKLAPIKGKMLNQISELSGDILMSDSGFKRLVSTQESIRIDPKWGFPEEYVPSCKHVICTNNLPTVRDFTEATFERMALIKFSNPVPATEQDKFLNEKFQAEMPGILAWSIRGAERLYRKNGDWTYVPESAKELKEYREEQNGVIAFLRDKCIPTNDGFIVMEEFRDKLNKWDPNARYKEGVVTKMLKKAGYTAGEEKWSGGRCRRVLKGWDWARDGAGV